MAAVGLLLLFALMAIHAANGRQFHIDTGNDGIQTYLQDENTGAITAGETTVSGAIGPFGRRSCYLGDEIVYIDDNGNSILTSEGNAVWRTPNAENIWGLACCCNMVAITYFDGNSGNLTVDIAIWGDSSVPYVRHDLQETNDGVLQCHKEAGLFFVLTSSSVWAFPFDDLKTPLFKVPLDVDLIPRQPTCLTVRNSRGSFDLFVSLVDFNEIASISIDDVTYRITYAGRFPVTDRFPLTVYCLDLDGDSDDLFLFTRIFASPLYEIRQISADGVIQKEDLTPSVVSGLDGNSAGGVWVNGISVCGSSCYQYSCTISPPPVCSCVDPCGFCVYDSTQCQCENSLHKECVYRDDTAREMCEQCRDRLDASLLVRNPIAERLTGDVEVFGVMAGEDGTISISREVKVGRFDPDIWPLPVGATRSDKTVAGLTVEGFDAPPPSRLRGSRFGVFLAKFGATNVETQRPVSIAGIVTENSGFSNAIYTKTVSEGDDVELEASMVEGLLRFRGSLQWRLTKINPNTGEPLDAVTPDCDFDPNRLTCGLTGVTKEDDEGVYEVFRPSRRLRNWHPIFYLYVRECSEGMYGQSCSQTCRRCVNGQCNERCGECVCYPGWTGGSCDTACMSEDEFGDSCSMSCTDIFPDSVMCKGMLICRPDQTGCACRSGLQPPECVTPCEDGQWGANCRNECDCEEGVSCNPRTGICNDP